MKVYGLIYRSLPVLVVSLRNDTTNKYKITIGLLDVPAFIGHNRIDKPIWIGRFPGYTPVLFN